MSDWRIPLADLDFDAEETAAVKRVLDSKWLSMGPQVEQFEQEFARYIGVKYAFAVANGTAALHLCYLALKLGSGDEIIQPAINFVAAANMTVATGAKPVFADIVSLDDPTIDPAEIERNITSRTRAVVVMHYAGYPCHLAEISALCKERRLFLIEDACHALGARFSHPPHSDEAKKLGSLGDAAAFSFFSNKNLATGEGGMVTTNRDDVAESVRLLRSHGMTTLTWDRYRGHSSTYDAVTHGYNYRFNEIGAALGRAQLAKLERNNCRRAELVSRYRENLCGVDHWQVPFSGSSAHSAFHLMVVVAPSATIRNEAVRALTQARIQTSRHYPSIPSLSSFHEFRSNDLSRSDSFASRAITLPLYPALTVQQIDEICSYLCLQPV